MKRWLPALLLVSCRCEEPQTYESVQSAIESNPAAIIVPVWSAPSVEDASAGGAAPSSSAWEPPTWSFAYLEDIEGVWKPGVTITKNSHQLWDLDIREGYNVWCELNPTPQPESREVPLLTWYVGWCKEAGQKGLPTTTRVEFQMRGEVLHIFIGRREVRVTR